MKLMLFTFVASLVLVGSNMQTASAHSLTTTQKTVLKKKYYHASGYIKVIGKQARRTIYHPNPRISHKWRLAVKYLIEVKTNAWNALHPPVLKPTLTSTTDGGWLDNAFLCIHHYEGSWTANTGNGYYGGLQMDLSFQSSYGSEYLDLWGTADNWPVWAQINAAERAYHSGRGFGPWPNTARMCKLI